MGNPGEKYDTILIIVLLSTFKAEAMTFEEAFSQINRKPVAVLVYAQWADDYQKYIESSNDKDVENLNDYINGDTYFMKKLIAEFIGRIPIYAVLDMLDEKTLQMILTEPKNAILKQYQCLLKMDGVDLEFEPDAIELIAQEAIKRKTGARALRSIVEELMLNIMYDIPSNKDIDKFIISKEMVEARNKVENTAELIELPSKKEAAEIA